MNTLLQRAQHEGTPLIDGEQVTFIWQGEEAPLLIGDFNNWGWVDQQLQGIEMQLLGDHLWGYTLTLPADSYIEYNFVSVAGDDSTIQRDPFNKRLIASGVGHDNHYFDMPCVEHTPLIRRRRGIKAGTITRHIVRHPFLLAGGKRDVWLYHPPTDQPVPFVLVYDGRDYLKRALLAQIVDNLIATGSMKPVALVFFDNGKDMRVIEYAQGEAILQAFFELVLPLMREHLNLSPEPGANGVLGASMGGLMALHSGLRAPDIFGHVISQSGALWETVGPVPTLIRCMIEQMPVAPIRIWQDVGAYESLVHDNRSMHQLLVRRGYDVTWREYNGGHNYTSWRDQLPQALLTMFGTNS